MVANFRLKTRHDCFAAHLRKIGIYEYECILCQKPNSIMDMEHLLYCSKHDTDQQVLKNIIKLYWDATAMTTSPPSAIGTTTTTTTTENIQQELIFYSVMCEAVSSDSESEFHAGIVVNIRQQNVIKSRPENTPRILVVLICSLGGSRWTDLYMHMTVPYFLTFMLPSTQ